MRKTLAALAAAFVAFGARSALAETISAITETGTLVTFDGDRPGEILSSVTVTGLQPAEEIVGIDVRPATGRLYALTGAGRLYVIDPNTGVASGVLTLSAALAGTDFGIDFNPVVDRLRVISNTGQNLRVNPDTGAVTVDTPLAFATGDSNVGLAPTVVDPAYIDNTPGVASTTLFAIDVGLLCTKTLPNGTQVDAPCLVRVGGTGGVPSPNSGELSTIDAFGREGITVRGFDVSPGGRAYTAVTLATSPNIVVALVTIDLSTAIDQSLGYVGDGEVAIRDIAVLPSVQFSRPLYAGREGGFDAVLQVTRTGGTVGTVTVDYATVSGSAIAGRDYATARGTLTFADGDASETITIPTPDDGVQENDETFQVFLSDPTGGGLTIGSPGAATVRISASDITDRSGPVITNFGLTGPSGGITGAVVRFNEDMDPASAANLANYALVGLPRKGPKLNVSFSSVVYDPVERTATLTATTPFQQPMLKGVVFTARGRSPAGLKDVNGNFLDGKRNGRQGADSVTKFKVFTGTTIKVQDADGDVATITITGGGHLDGLYAVDRSRRRTQFWIVGAIPLSSTITGSVTSKPRSDGIVQIAEIIGLDKKEFAPFLKQSSITVSRLTFSTNATGL